MRRYILSAVPVLIAMCLFSGNLFAQAGGLNVSSSKEMCKEVRKCITQGPAGPRGPAGPQGPAGPEGPQGPMGEPGPQATTAVTTIPNEGILYWNWADINLDGYTCSGPSSSSPRCNYGDAPIDRVAFIIRKDENQMDTIVTYQIFATYESKAYYKEAQGCSSNQAAEILLNGYCLQRLRASPPSDLCDHPELRDHPELLGYPLYYVYFCSSSNARPRIEPLAGDKLREGVLCASTKAVRGDLAIVGH